MLAAGTLGHLTQIVADGKLRLYLDIVGIALEKGRLLNPI